MTTIRITTDCALPPARVLYAAYDFGPQRIQVWPAVRAEHLSVPTWAERPPTSPKAPLSASASTGNDATTTGPNPAGSPRQ